MVVADRIMVLRNGVIQQGGAPFSVYNEPASIFVANFVGGASFLEGFIADKDKHGSWVRLRNGLVIRTDEASYSTEERVILAIREEMTQIFRDAQRMEEVNLLPGTIQTRSFLGSFSLYEVLLENGDVVRSKVPVYADEVGLRSGEKVHMLLEPKYIKVYPYPAVGLYKELEVI